MKPYNENLEVKDVKAEPLQRLNREPEVIVSQIDFSRMWYEIGKLKGMGLKLNL